MTPDEIINRLKKEFPGKPIFPIPDDDPTEIICETAPAINHPEFSEAIAYIKKSSPHRHLQTTEKYVVLKGQLILYIDGLPIILKQGEEYKIMPGIIHWAEGDWTKVKVTSSPGWTANDHILVTRAISAGGILLKKDGGIENIILVKLPEGIFVFPKGHIKKGETPEKAALREVHEETGISKLKIVSKLGIITRPAREKRGSIVIKDIHLYLMTTSNWHEGSKDEVTIWLPLTAAINRMYPQEADFLRKLITEGKI